MDLWQQLKPALAGKLEIEQEQVVGALFQDAQTRLAVDGHLDGVAFEGEQHLERFANARFVVNDQDAGVGGRVGGGYKGGLGQWI